MLNNWIIYLLESSVCLMFFYAFYKLFLQQETFFKTNRRYLQLTMAVSLLIPLAENLMVKLETGSTATYMLETVVITAQRAEFQTRTTLTQLPWITISIALTSLLFIGLFAYSIARVVRILRSSEKLADGHVTYVINSQIEHPFTFLRYIFVDKELYNNPKHRHIIEHEKTHALQKHTLDLLISSAIAAILWFNPFAWLYREAFREIHEYLADDHVLKQGADPTLYKQSVFNQAIGLWPGSFSFFNVSFIKRRFIMMTKVKSPKSNMLKVLMMVPVAAFMIFVFACTTDELSPEVKNSPDVKNEKVATNNNSETTEQQFATTEENHEKTFEVVEQMPEFKGGQKAFFTYLQENISYPAEAKEKGVSGKVFVKFVVTETGAIDQVGILRGVHPLLDEEAMRVIKKMPMWEPGKEKGKPVRVKFNVPINFKLN